MDIRPFLIHDYQGVKALQQKYSANFIPIRDRIYSDLMKLRRRDAFRLETSWKDVPMDLKIGIICLFLMEQTDDRVMFDNNYQFVIKR